MTDTAPPQPDKPIRLSFQTHDVDEFRGLLSSLHAPVRVKPLGSEPFVAGVDAVMTGGVCISSAHHPAGVDLNFSSVFDGYGLSLPASGSLTVFASRRGPLQTRPDVGLMMDSSSVSRTILLADTSLNRISVTTAEMHGRLADLIDQPILRRIRFAPEVSVESPAGKLAMALSRLMYEGVAGGEDAPLLRYPAALTSLREAILNLLLESVPHSYSDQLSRQARLLSPVHVKRAIDFMSANASKPLRMSDIATASGTSVRSLQSGFMRFRGMPPMAYLRNIRLNGARAELLLAGFGTTVSHIAYTWGFPSLPYFSTLYLRAFGERPSTTLRRSSR